MSDKHIGRFVNEAELTKASRVSLRDDADTDDLIWLTSVVPAMAEEIRKRRAADLNDEDLEMLRHYHKVDGHTLCAYCVKARDVIDKLLKRGAQ